jgi:iron complex transport system permease protein
MIKMLWLIVLLCFALLSAAFSLNSGSVSLSQLDPELFDTIFWQIRLPRVQVAFLVGALLGLSGVLLQILVGNPLAEPYILGVSGGASVGAISGILLGFGSFSISIMAFVGALISMLLVFSLIFFNRHSTTLHLLLTGVVIASGWGALINLLLSLGNAEQLQSILFWLMGDISHTAPKGLGFFVLITGVLLSLYLARALNVLAMGEQSAKAVGVPVRLLQGILFVLASCLTAIAVTMAGSIGFVGLVAPHLMRFLVGTDHRYLIPATVLFSGGLLMLADTIARTIIAPQQLPVGVMTALIGVPIFLFLLVRSSRIEQIS